MGRGDNAEIDEVEMRKLRVSSSVLATVGLALALLASDAAADVHGTDSGFRYNSARKKCLNAQGASGYNLGFWDPERKLAQCSDLRCFPRGQHFRDYDLRGSMMIDTHLYGRNFESANLSRAHLERAFVRGANFSNAILAGAFLMGIAGERARFRGADLRQSNFLAASLTLPDFKGANAINADFSSAVLQTPFFQGASLRGAVFNGAILHTGRFARASGKAYFTRAKITAANFDYANMPRASFAQVVGFCHYRPPDPDLQGGPQYCGTKWGLKPAPLGLCPSFHQATLRYANFNRAKLQDASFRYADLRGVDFRGADLRYAAFTGAKLGGARFDGRTRLPFSKAEAQRRGMVFAP